MKRSEFLLVTFQFSYRFYMSSYRVKFEVLIFFLGKVLDFPGTILFCNLILLFFTPNRAILQYTISQFMRKLYCCVIDIGRSLYSVNFFNIDLKSFLRGRKYFAYLHVQIKSLIKFSLIRNQEKKNVSNSFRYKSLNLIQESRLSKIIHNNSSTPFNTGNESYKVHWYNL